MLADIDNLGFNSSPTIDGAPIGLRDQPYADTISFGVEREMMDNLSLGCDVVRTQTKHSIVRARLNMRSAEFGRPNISIFNGEVNTNFNDIDVDMNRGIDARTTHTSLLVSLRKRMSDTVIGRLSGRLSYTLSSSSGNVDNRAFAQESRFQRFSVTGFNFDTNQITGVTPNNSILGLDDPRGSGYPVSFSRKHNFVVSGSWIIPRTSWRENGGIVLSGIFRTLTGARATFIDSSDEAELDNGNVGIAPAGTYSANEPNDISFSDQLFEGTRFGHTDPTSVTLDFSLRYRIPFGSRGWYATLSLDAFNIFDRVNFENSGSTDSSSGAFLIPNEAFPMRVIQGGVKFTY